MKAKKPNGFEESEGNFEKPKKPDNDNEDEDDNDIKKKKSKRKTFTPPKLEEIEKYVLEKKLNVDAKKFYDYFNEGNWIDSKGNQVKSWKQKLLTWNSYPNKQERPREKPKESNFEERQYSKQDFNGLYANVGGIKQ